MIKNLKAILFIAFLFMQATSSLAWKEMTMPKLHIEGRYLMDEYGNKVNLHGFGQTYSPWFNEQGTKWSNYNVSSCLYYNKTKITQLLNKGWKVNWMRLHMDPYWTSPGANGEADISTFSMERFEKYFKEVYLPMANYAEGKGLYVVMRPPGVCPESIAPGDDYQNYLIQVWTYVAKQMVANNNTSFMFELANEPIKVNGSITTFFQKVVDAIRATGCKNILWVPGSGYQSDYTAYAANPIKGENIGYAVHAYPGWYGSDAEQESAEATGDVAGGGYKGFLNGWYNRVMCVAKFAPILVTEMDWAPKAEGNSWGKSTTGTRCGKGFGANFMYLADLTGNVSWMLFTGPELMAKYDDAAEDGKVFLTDPEACARPIYRQFANYAPEWPVDQTDDAKTLVSLELGCDPNMTVLTGGIATIPVDATYADGHKVCVTATAKYSFSNPDMVTMEGSIIKVLKDGTTDVNITLTDAFGTSKTVQATLNATSFPLTAEDFNPSIWESGSFDEKTGTLITGQYGFGGWQYNSGIDISNWKYLVIELPVQQSASASFRLFDENNYWSNPAQIDIGSAKKKVIELATLKKNNSGASLNLHHIYIAGFWTVGGKPVRIKSVFLTNDKSATGVERVEAEKTPLQNRIYNLQGQRVKTMNKGQIYIINGRKTIAQ